ncbi:MAG: PrsW family intramembrane metalloprotease [Verrucomicrobiae bacterium]|nr:PrsW family intramembrane metalloprotease [Verrucomicrobiae bacterium]
MKYSRSQIFRLSRDPRILVRFAAGIAVVSIITAAAISFFTRDRDAIAPGLSPEKVVPHLHEHQGDESKDEVEWATKIRRAEKLADAELDFSDLPFLPYELQQLGVTISDENEKADPKTLEEFEQAIEEDTELVPAERERLIALARGLMMSEESPARRTAIAFLSKAGTSSAPQPFAAEYLGDVLSLEKDWNLAIDAYRTEVERAPRERPWALDRLLDLLAREGRIEEISRIQGLPDWVEYFAAYHLKKQLTENRDYWGLFVQVVKYDFKIETPTLALLSLLAAMVWALILIRFSDRWRAKAPLFVVAIALGYFSATLTIYAVWLQQTLLHFTHDPRSSLIDQIIYCVAGIGLREETLKLLMFLPLVPFLAKRSSDIDALILAGLVGLGFAFNENIGYLHREGEFDTWGRFLTANFLHIALTGIAGLSLVRCWRRPKRNWDQFLYDFLIVVAAHGAYDAMIMVPQLEDLQILSIVVFALIAYLFLDHAVRLMDASTRMTVSPLAVFVLGAAALMGIVLCYACWGMPFREAFKIYAVEVADMIPIAFVFINRLRPL